MDQTRLCCCGTVRWPGLDLQNAAVNPAHSGSNHGMPMLPGGWRQHAACTNRFIEPGTVHLALLDGRDPMSETWPLNQCLDGDGHGGGGCGGGGGDGGGGGGGGGGGFGGVAVMLLLVVVWKVVEEAMAVPCGWDGGEDDGHGNGRRHGDGDRHDSMRSRVLILIVGVVSFLQVLPCCQAG